MSILDRYVIRQVLAPFILALLVFTFVLIIPGLRDYAEGFISKGASPAVVANALATLIPGALALSIPMSLLLGLLVAFGKLSGDREFVAMQACGVSLMRLLRPVTILALLSASVTAWVWMVGMPAGNIRFRQIAFEIIANLAEGEVKPRVFFDQFPGLTLYVRDVPRSGGWEGVFLSDARSVQRHDIYVARQGSVIIDRVRQTVELVLRDAVRHSSDNNDKTKYEISAFTQAVIGLNPDAMFPRGGPPKGDREMTLAELEARAQENVKNGFSDRSQRFEIQAKFAIPFGCLVFGLIGLALGATNRRDGTLAGFVVALIVIFAYYALHDFGRGLGLSGDIPVWTAAWLPNMVLGLLGALLLALRRRVADQSLIPAFLLRLKSRQPRAARLWRLPISILDRYVAANYLRVLLISMLSLATIFYVSTFVDQAAKAFRGAITWEMLFSYIWYLTPQYVYYIIPLSVLIATLTTIALLTKSSELIVMRACGISLYRTAAPLLVAALVAGASLFAIEETLLGPANRRAAQLRMIMDGHSADTLDISKRRWVAGNNGTLYHFNFFDSGKRHFLRLSIFEFSPQMERLTTRSFATDATSLAPGSEVDARWRLQNGWTRTFDDHSTSPPYQPFTETSRVLEPVAHFTTAAPYPEFMSFTDLKAYTERLDVGGTDVVPQRAALARKVSFPFVTLVMALIAVPFAVTIGRSGAMAGIGVAIAVAIAYWVIISVFTALGAGGAMPPQLAAWAPNVLFAAAAVYLLLSVRT